MRLLRSVPFFGFFVGALITVFLLIVHGIGVLVALGTAFWVWRRQSAWRHDTAGGRGGAHD